MAEHDTRDAEGDQSVTFINVFEIPVDQLDVFIDGWRERARLMSKAPGFLDTKLHRALSSDTRFQLINIAHWESEQAWRDAIANAEFQATRQEALADSHDIVHPNVGLYEVSVEFG